MPYYNIAFKKLFDGDIAILVDTITVALTTSTYSPNVDTDEFADDITNEIAGGGYARKTLTTKTTIVDAANDRAEFSSDDVTGWNADTWSAARYMVFIVDLGADAVSPVLAYIDFGSNKDAPIEVNAPAEGWLTLGACP